MPKKWQHLGPNSSQDWCFLGPASEKSRWNATNFKDIVALQMVHMIKCLTSHRGTFENKRFWIYHVFTIEFASGVRLKIRYLHREERKTESKSISNPSSWLWLRKTSDQWHKLEAIRCCNSQNIAKHWFGELPNRQHSPERWKMDNLYHQRICYGRKRFYF